MRIRNIFRNILMISGVLFWIFIFFTLVEAPSIIFWAGMLFWMFIGPGEILGLFLLIIATVLYAVVLEIFKKNKNEKRR